ncbi:DUF4190 domain-containing protein [Candidatus Galacturonibacter soehngenii]|uniref:DUF4190 domain-containing protein n=1 Tax=Candidatus Galacturonatibacter soehngenii TaxID=2307010 RepID=A0A7V7UAT7_9FIRM|nr:DUF4190 domain-containing protein [Candidatus Galacturonibacter soehngenii]KAB1434545.1 DUF4190 domain-containing protein [Candidatus Galacturonibacter soehngenii]
MDNNNHDSFTGNSPVVNNNYYNHNQPNSMATAALVLGILAIISICCVYGSYLFGGIAITLALLSRGRNNKLSTNALIGTILSIIGMLISTVIIAILLISIFTSDRYSDFMNYYESLYEEIYGEEFPYGSDTFNGNSEKDYKDDNSNTYDYYNYFKEYFDEYDTAPVQPTVPDTLSISFD